MQLWVWSIWPISSSYVCRKAWVSEQSGAWGHRVGQSCDLCRAVCCLCHSLFLMLPLVTYFDFDWLIMCFYKHVFHSANVESGQLQLGVGPVLPLFWGFNLGTFNSWAPFIFVFSTCLCLCLYKELCILVSVLCFAHCISVIWTCWKGGYLNKETLCLLCSCFYGGSSWLKYYS